LSTTNTKPSKADALAIVQALIAGTNKRFSNQSLSIGNTTYSAATLVQLLQSLADAINKVNAAEVSARDAVAAMRVIEATVKPVIGNYRRFLRASFGTSSAALADFGLTPQKARAPRTSEQKAAAAAKLRATRAKRGTTSKKQKLAVIGDVTGVTITPVTQPPATTPSTQPAPATSNVPTTGTSTK
jgi:hypothetical protein